MGRLGGRGRAIEGSQTLRTRNNKGAVQSDTPGTAGGLMRRTASKAVALAFPQHGVGTNMQRSRCIAHPAGIETHIDDRLLHFRQAPAVAIVEQETPLGTASVLTDNRLRVFRRAKVAYLCSGVGSKQETSAVSSEKCVARWGSEYDEMRMITTSFARVLERCIGHLYMPFS